MTEKSAKNRLDWKYYLTKKKICSSFIFGAICILLGSVIKYLFLESILISYLSICFFIIGQYLLIYIQLKTIWADKIINSEFRKFIPDRWLITKNNDFIYINSYIFSKIEKKYDMYVYEKEQKINDIGNIISEGDYKFKLKKENFHLHTISYYNSKFRYATEEEIKEKSLNVYIAKILLIKDDNKYQKYY